MEKLKSFLFENKTLKQTFFKNTFWLTLGTGTSKIIHAVLIIVAARILHADGYGVLAYALSFAGFFTIFSDIGLSSLLTREMAKRKDEEAIPYLATTFYLKLVLITLSIVFTAVVGPYFTKIEAVKSIIPIIAFLTAFDSMSNFFFSVTRAYNKMEIESRFVIFTEVMVTSLSLIALLIHPTPGFMAFGYTLGSGIGCLAIGIKIRKIWMPAIKHSFDKKLIKEIVSSAWPFAIMGLLGSFMINIDSLIIGWFRNAYELGLYAAAQKPVQLIYILPSLMSVSLFPLVSKMVHEKRNGDVEKITNQLFRSVLLIALPMTLGGIILGHEFISLVFGSSYLPATLTFQLLLLTLIPVFAGIIIGNVVFAYNQQKIFLRTTLIGAILNTGLDFLLIPTYGIPGSAVATIISQICANSYTWHELNKTIKIPIFKGLGRGIAATIIMSALAYFMTRIGIPIIPTLLVSVISYPLLLILFREPLLKSVPIINRFAK
ncbi:oligosaccharide flippase family protein [Patescibacteria group bacterium]|nr:oligosaccharide flippase family protein [Patescibacteria group bacterium]